MFRAVSGACSCALVALTLSAVEPPDLVAARILGHAAVDDGAWQKLSWLCDRIGHRLSGSAALESAVGWSRRELEASGVDRVWLEPVRVPHWVRGRESAAIVAPVERPMAVLALGGSVATPPGGVTAEVIGAASFDELTALGEAVRGKIVLFHQSIEGGFDAPNGYGSAAKLRVSGASRAAAQGAVAMLIRSLGTADFRLPHTGAMRYEEGPPAIPGAAIAAEDAALILRLLEAGERVRVRLEIDCRTLEDAESANVLGEIAGREKPEEIVLIGAHLDSWDVGDGAHDDGAGCAIVMQVMELLKKLELRPRRTIRAVLFTNEENGGRGGKDYAARHGHESHVVAIETDSGGFAPVGFGVSAGAGGLGWVEQLARPLAAIGASEVREGGGGADIEGLQKLGVPVMSLRHDTARYFDYHHSAADTLDKVDPHDLGRNVAALAWMAWSLAEHDGVLPRLEPKPGP